MLALAAAALVPGCRSAEVELEERTRDLGWELVFEDNDEVSTGELVENLDEEVERLLTRGFRKSDVDDLAFGIELYYRSIGHHFARVEYDFSPGRAVIRIDEGPRVLIERVSFIGNSVFSADRLHELLSASRQGFLGLGEPIYVQSQVAGLEGAVEELYLERGYQEVRVSEPLTEFSPDRSTATINISIEEGPQYVVEGIDFAEVPLIAQSELAERFEYLRGSAFVPRIRFEVRSGIEDLYADIGRPEADVDVSLTTVPGPPDARRVGVAFRVVAHPGQAVRIGEIRIIGNDETAGGYIRSRILIEEGALYNGELIRRSFRRMLRTGLFRSVDLRLAPAGDGGAGPDGAAAPAAETPSEAPARPGDAAPPPEGEARAPEGEAAEAPAGDGTLRPGGVAAGAGTADAGDPGAAAPDVAAEGGVVERDLIVEVVEGASLEYFFEVGFGSYDLARGRVGVREKNILGRGLIGRAELLGSVRGAQATVGLTDPWFLESDWSADLPVTALYREEPSFTLLEGNVGLRLSRPITRRLTGGGAYRFTLSRVEDFAIEDIAREMPDLLLGAAGPFLEYDSRDDILVPSRGIRSRIFGEVGHPYLGGEIEFLHGGLTISGYLPIFEDTILAANAQTEWIVPFEDTGLIPIQERLFNGGENSVRSFQQDELGPLDVNGEPLGGEVRNLLSLEIRQRVIGNFFIAAFADYGNVARTDSKPFDDFRPAVGFGVRYGLPIGPVRLDVGFNPDDRENEDFYVIHFAVGLPY